MYKFIHSLSISISILEPIYILLITHINNRTKSFKVKLIGLIVIVNEDFTVIVIAINVALIAFFSFTENFTNYTIRGRCNWTYETCSG